MSNKKGREGSVGRFDKEDLLKDSLKLIKRHKLCFVEDLIAFLPCCKKTFYNKGLHELHEIKDAIHKQRISKKLSLRNKWEDSENATLQMGLYKLLANDDELERLNNSKQKTEVVIRDDRTEAEIMQSINAINEQANAEEYDIESD